MGVEEFVGNVDGVEDCEGGVSVIECEIEVVAPCEVVEVELAEDSDIELVDVELKNVETIVASLRNVVAPVP